MTNCAEDELSVQKQKCKKQLEEINSDLLTHQRSLEWLRTKLVILKSKANPSSKSSGSGILENQQKEDDHNLTEKTSQGVRAKRDTVL